MNKNCEVYTIMDPLILLEYTINNNKLVIKINKTNSLPNELIIILKDRKSKFEQQVKARCLERETYYSTVQIIDVDLSDVMFNKTEKNALDVQILNNNKKYKLTQSSNSPSNIANKASLDVHRINDHMIARAYLTKNKNLAILYGTLWDVYSAFNKKVIEGGRIFAEPHRVEEGVKLIFNDFLLPVGKSILLEDITGKTYILNRNYSGDLILKADSALMLDIFSGINSMKLHVLSNYNIIQYTVEFLKEKSDHPIIMSENDVKTVRLKSYLSITEVKFRDNQLNFKLQGLNTNNYSQVKVLFKKRKEEIWYECKSEFKPEGYSTLCTIDIYDFQKRYGETPSRWDVFLELKHGNIVELNRLGCYKNPISPTHQRFYQSVNNNNNLLTTPYLTASNGFSIIIESELRLYNLQLKSQVQLNDLVVKKGKMLGLLELTLEESSRFTIKNLVLRHRNKLGDIVEEKIPVKLDNSWRTVSIVSFEINLKEIKLEPLYWDIYIFVDVEGSNYLIPFKVNNKKIEYMLDNKIIKNTFTNSNGYIAYPYETIHNNLAIAFRKKVIYDSKIYKIKERLAFFFSRVFKRYYKKKDIWLSFEKFSETAQDNAYHFFKYVYENHPKENIYYVIKKDSPDIQYLKGMEDRVIKFMSFKHLLYLFVSNIFISSESQSHSYILNEQRGMAKKSIYNKHMVFLQHGVIGLKKNLAFKKDSRYSMDLFVVSSDWEKEIVHQYYNYDKKEIINVGLCRWDALEDHSPNLDKKEILLMPTWRSWLDSVSDKTFLDSNYYKEYFNLLNSPRLQKLLERHQVVLNFNIHPKLKEYVKQFSTQNKNMKIFEFGEERVNKLLMNNSLLITDYSSVAWDQYYQHKPVVFYQFDSNLYSEIQGSYLNLEQELFGDKAVNVDELVDLIEEYIKRDFKEKNQYAKDRKNYFTYNDKENCKRTYQAIKRY